MNNDQLLQTLVRCVSLERQCVLAQICYNKSITLLSDYCRETVEPPQDRTLAFNPEYILKLLPLSGHIEADYFPLRRKLDKKLRQMEKKSAKLEQ